MTHHLEADSIQLEFGDRKILSGAYIQCQTGEIAGLLGRNGQGKSCLMQMVYGTLAGEKSVRIDKVAYPEAYKRPGLLLYLPQFNFIPKRLSLRRVFNDFEVDFFPFQQLFPEFASKFRAPIGSLSGGGQRLVELYVIAKSRALFTMLDEPFTHLSPLQIEKVKELLLQEKHSKGFLISDHMYRPVLDITDTVYVLVHGHTYKTKSLQDIETMGYVSL